MNKIHNSFIKHSWIVHEGAMNLLLDSSWCCRYDDHSWISMFMNYSWIPWILECSWIFHEQNSWFIHQTFMNSSWRCNELIIGQFMISQIWWTFMNFYVHELFMKHKHSWMFINLFSWTNIHDLKMSNNKFIAPSWTIHEYFMNIIHELFKKIHELFMIISQGRGFLELKMFI